MVGLLEARVSKDGAAIRSRVYPEIGARSPMLRAWSAQLLRRGLRSLLALEVAEAGPVGLVVQELLHAFLAAVLLSMYLSASLLQLR